MLEFYWNRPRFSSNCISWVFHHLSISNISLSTEEQVDILKPVSLSSVCKHSVAFRLQCGGQDVPPAMTPCPRPPFCECSETKRHSLGVSGNSHQAEYALYVDSRICAVKENMSHSSDSATTFLLWSISSVGCQLATYITCQFLWYQGPNFLLAARS